MENKDEIKFSVFSKEQYDSIFKDFEKIPKKWNPSRITKKIQEKITLSIIPSYQLTSEICDTLKFYRIRVPGNTDVIDENKLSSFSYPPKQFCDMRRANRKGQQVLYTSLDNHTPFFETANQIKVNESIVYLTKWKIKKHPNPLPYYRSIFLGLDPGDDANYSSIMIKGLNDQVHEAIKDWPEEVKTRFLYGQKKYTELYTSKGDTNYHITSSMIYNSFINAAKQNIQIPIVFYPSVAKINRSVNAVFRKDFVDQYMEISEIYKVVVTELTEETLRVTLLKKAIVQNGEIQWQTLVLNDLNVNYDDARVISSNKPGESRKLNGNERLVFCCEDHKVTIKQFLEKNNVTEDTIKRNLAHTSIDVNFDKIPDRIEKLFYAETYGKVYVDSDPSGSELIKFIEIPISYSLKYS